jgi:hypothetical protein
LLRAVPKDQVLTLADVARPAGRLCDRLWDEQNAHFALTPAALAPAEA